MIEITMAERCTALVLDGGTRRIAAQGVPDSLVAIFVAGGLVSFLAEHRGFTAIA